MGAPAPLCRSLALQRFFTKKFTFVIFPSTRCVLVHQVRTDVRYGNRWLEGLFYGFRLYFGATYETGLCKNIALLKYRVESKVDNLIMLNAVLKRFTDCNVVLRPNLKTEALQYWKPIVESVVEYVKAIDGRFSKMRRLPTGSYYEMSKVGEPDEFDWMLVVEGLELDDDPYDDDEHDGISEPPEGWYLDADHDFK